MSFPSGDVIVMPFVGVDDDNEGTVAPPQGSDFSRTFTMATTTTASKTRTARIASPLAPPSSALAKLGGGA